MRRREAIKGIGALAGAAAAPGVLGSCAGGDEAGITHIVVVMMENRSYDHYMGARSLEGLGGNGLAPGMTNPSGTGSVEVYHETEFCIPDPPHDWEESRTQYALGANTGFIEAYKNSHGASVPPHVMGYYTREQIPFLWGMADEYASCDAWFCSVLGPTWPNRLYLLSGQSGGTMVNSPPPQGFSWKTIFHSLDEAGVPWGYYFQDFGFLPLFPDFGLDPRIQSATRDFFRHAENGTLPPVSFVEPEFGSNDDHPPHHPMLGQMFMSSVYHALARSPLWNNVLIVYTYDEHGGFYDHVAPPKAADDRAAEGFDQLGFRVPTLVAGPYVKQGHVSSVVRDHTSVLAHINNMFGLAPLTARDAAAADLSELLDEQRLLAGNPRPPAELPSIEVDIQTIPSICFGGDRIGLLQATEEGLIDRRWDRRHLTRDFLHEVGEWLDRFGGGRLYG